jgi:hypothetical protein
LPTIAVVTEDFSLYHDLVVRLKRRGISFASLSPKDPLPDDVGVVITSPQEEGRIKFRPVVVTRGDLEDAVDQALKALAGREPYQQVAVGIDPGRHIGVAALADGVVISSARVDSIDEAVNRVRLFLQRHPAKRQVIRIGHGSPTQRNVLIHRLENAGVPIEIVDETRTTQDVEMPDVRAAISIAAGRGARVDRPPKIAVSPGEVKDIQRISRIKSQGRFTIPRSMAHEVAIGSLSLDDAVRRYRRERRADESLDLTREEE